MYENMTYEGIQESMLERMKGMDSREGSVAHDAVATVAYSLEKIYFELDNYLSLVSADTSAGEYLDRFSVLMNVRRKKAVKAIRIGIFDREINIGTRFTILGNESLIYAALEDNGKIDSDHTYLMECETAGDIGNDYSGDLIPVEYITGLGKAQLGKIIVLGTEEETDDALRERLLVKVQRPSTSGNINDYYNWAMSCPGVGAVRIFPLSDGPGTVKVVIVDSDKTAADESLVSSVAEYIESVRPIGATVSVVSAKEKAINVSARVRVAESVILDNAQNAFRQAVEGYLQGNAFEAGYISLARIGNLLLDIPGVEDYTELKLNGTAGNVSIAEEEVAVTGAVRLEG